MGWVGLAVLAGLAGWLLWRSLPRPVTVPGGPPADPFAGEVAEFMRAVGDWCRG